MIFDRFRKKEQSLQEPFMDSAQLPDDLERFRMRPPDTRLPEARPDPRMAPAPMERSDYPVPELPATKTVEDLVSERTKGDKIELILQKLDTIDTRLRLMEERTRKY